jgi:hypothetical protein
MKLHSVVLEFIIPYRQMELGDISELHRAANPTRNLR